MGASPMGLPQYQTGANYGYPMMQDGGDTDMDGDDQTFYTNRMNTFIQKIRDAAEKNLETAVMEQDQEQPMAQYGMNMNSDPMDSYNPGNLGAFGKTANYMKSLGQGAMSGYIQRMGALGPNDYYYKEKNIYKDTSKGAPLGSQLFTDADGNQSMISPEEAYDRANYALNTKMYGGPLKKYQPGGEEEEDFWSPEETAYINSLPRNQQLAILKQGVAGKSDVQKRMQQSATPPKASVTNNNSSRNSSANTNTNTGISTTANNTSTNTTTTTANNTNTNTNTATNTTVPNGSQTIGGNGNPNMLYNGHNSTNENTTVINGVRYAVDPVTKEVLGYNSQSSTGTQNYNNYNPYGTYNPYAAYGSMRGRNLGVISKNRLTKDFRENMLAGSYDNPQLLGVSEIKTRRAMDPGNRVKSITYSYGQPIPSGRTTINKPAANNSTQTSSGSSSTTPNTGVKVNPPALDPNDPRTISPAVKAAEDYTFRPWQNLQNLPAEGPINQNDGAGPRDMPSPDVTYDPFVSSYIPRYNTYPDLDNSGNVSPVRVMANNTVPETDTDPYLDPATDPRGANYGKEDYPEDLKLDESGVVVQGSDNNYYVKMPDGTIQKSMDREVLRKKTGFAKGGSLHRFMRAYQDGGPFSVREMSIGDMPETVDQIVSPESNNTPMEFKPSEMTDADRLRAIEGTNAVDYDPEGMAPAFDVKTKTKKKRIGNPEKDLAFINMATGLFNARNAAYAETELRNRSQASQVFNPMRSTEGNYDILSGDFRRGRRAADGNDAFHSGFGNYAQMGGSTLENLKEGDEVYLTEEQINEIVKRGGKLSYL
jgi:hypothetical protein